MKRRLTAATIVTLAAAAIGGGAYAARSQEHDALAIANAKVSLTQAIAAAEQNVGGKAAKAAFEQANQKWVFEVEIVKDGKILEVKVDAETGNVISSAAEKDDDDDD